MPEYKPPMEAARERIAGIYGVPPERVQFERMTMNGDSLMAHFRVTTSSTHPTAPASA